MANARVIPGKRRRLIFAPSVPHCGTWFTLRLLCASPDIADRPVLWRPLREGEADVEAGVTALVLHTHLGIHPAATPLDHRKCCIRSTAELELFAQTLPTVIPLRDPIKSLLTRDAREPASSGEHIVEGFRMLAALRSPVFWFAVDRLEGSRERAYSLLDYLKIRPCPHDRIESWLPQNATGPTPNKLAYQAGDMRAVRRGLGKTFDHFWSYRHDIQPLFERAGYRSLPWFD